MNNGKAPKQTDINPGELYFSWYLDELKAEGYIKYYDREPETFTVFPSFDHKREKHFKTKDNTLEDISLLGASHYGYDYRVVWMPKALNVFTELYWPDGHFRFGIPTFVSHYRELMDEMEIVSYIDVKPPAAVLQFSGNIRSSHVFPFIQKTLMHYYGLYINKIVPANSGKHGIKTNLFAKTFTPNRYLFTDQASMSRKIPFKTNSLKNYVERQQSTINQLLKEDREWKAKSNQQTLL
jgi:hypothetical protein